MVKNQSMNAPPGGRHQRRLRNLLLDRQLQLKYTAYMVAVALAIGGALTLGLWRTGSELSGQAAAAVATGESAVELGKKVVAESQKVNAVVKMTIQKDPAYAEDPELLAAFQADVEEPDKSLQQQQQHLEQRAAALRGQADLIQQRRRAMLLGLPLVGLLLVLVIAAMGIYVTHKVAGPIYKMKRQLSDVGRGRLKVPQPLRKGDQLVDFFDTFAQMVVSLRQRQEQEILQLDHAIRELEQGADGEGLKALKVLRSEMQAALDA